MLTERVWGLFLQSNPDQPGRPLLDRAGHFLIWCVPGSFASTGGYFLWRVKTIFENRYNMC